jgi:glutamate-1-semialdehyde 2,1-aminomutase
MDVVPPEPGFLEGVFSVCRSMGTLVIFDEVITGLRLAPGGAQERFDVHPDLTCLGKVIGGGLPIGAVGGRDELMRLLAPEGPVYHAGTLSGNPVTCAAGVATIDLLDQDAYDRLEATANTLALGLRKALGRAGVSGCVNRMGSMLSVFFGIDAVRNFTDAKRSDSEIFRQVFWGLLREGIYAGASPLEAWFVSLEHSAADVERVVAAFGDALEEALR